jgi:hypothetical protein
VNALLYDIAYSNRALPLLEQFLGLAYFPGAKPIGAGLTDAHVLVEQSLSDFGDADAILLLDDADGTKTAVFVEAKVKTGQANAGTLDREFVKFQEECRAKLKSSLFTQLYYKARFIEGLRSGGIPLTGLKFPKRPSKKKFRKIGNNPVVLRAVDKIKPYREDVWFLSLVPGTRDSVRDFFNQSLADRWPQELRPVTWNFSRWGGVAWEQIAEFCKNENLANASRVLEFNNGEIF